MIHGIYRSHCLLDKIKYLHNENHYFHKGLELIAQLVVLEKTENDDHWNLCTLDFQSS